MVMMVSVVVWVLRHFSGRRRRSARGRGSGDVVIAIHLLVISVHGSHGDGVFRLCVSLCYGRPETGCRGVVGGRAELVMVDVTGGRVVMA